MNDKKEFRDKSNQKKLRGHEPQQMFMQWWGDVHGISFILFYILAQWTDIFSNPIIA